MRVALGTMYPYDEARVHGGVEAVAFNLAQALAATGQVEVHVVSFTTCVRDPLVERRGPVSVHWLPVRRGLGTLKALTAHPRRVAAVYEAIRADVVHAQAFSAYAIGAPTSIPLVLTVHGLERFSASMRANRRYTGAAGAYRRVVEYVLVKRSLDRATAVVAVPGPFVPGVLGAKLDGKAYRGIPNPLVLDRWLTVAPTRDDAQKVLCVGAIMRSKNQLALMRAFARARDDRIDSELVLLGETVERDYLEELTCEAKSLGLTERVRFLGHVNEDSLVAAYSDAAVVASASVVETAPMSVAEAMACARAVVATRTGGIPWMVEDGVSGYVVDLTNVEAMADRLRALLLDPLLRRRLGDSARRRATAVFGAGVVASQTVALYRELVG